MVREFKIRRTPFKVWLGVIIVIVAIVLMALHTENYWNLMPIVLPVLLLIDEQMTRILVQENGDIWLTAGPQGVFKYSKAENRLYHYDLNDHVYAQCLEMDDKGRIWVGALNGGLFLYNHLRKQFEKMETKGANAIPMFYCVVITGCM